MHTISDTTNQFQYRIAVKAREKTNDGYLRDQMPFWWHRRWETLDIFFEPIYVIRLLSFHMVPFCHFDFCRSSKVSQRCNSIFLIANGFTYCYHCRAKFKYSNHQNDAIYFPSIHTRTRIRTHKPFLALSNKIKSRKKCETSTQYVNVVEFSSFFEGE